MAFPPMRFSMHPCLKMSKREALIVKLYLPFFPMRFSMHPRLKTSISGVSRPKMGGDGKMAIPRQDPENTRRTVQYHGALASSCAVRSSA